MASVLHPVASVAPRTVRHNRARLSIVIPVYRGERTIGPLVQALVEHLGDLYHLEIVLVNDGSPDNSAEVCRLLAGHYEFVKFLNLSRNFSEHNAVMAGLALLGSALLGITGTLGGHLVGIYTQVSDALRPLGWEVYTTFYVPNLTLAVERCRGREEKRQVLERLVREVGLPGIVYVATRKSVELWGSVLAVAGMRTALYHAGLTDEERTKAQEGFLAGRVDVIVATNAFGMGVDKPDIRFVAHGELPGSIEAYYQEVGRAGRGPRAEPRALMSRRHFAATPARV